MRSVLVVDDDRLMVRTLCDLLRRRGYDAHGAHNGEEALAAAALRAWSVVLMDVRMEGMTGVDVLKELRKSRRAPPVVLMTAWSAAELLAEAAAAGATRVLSKPIAPELLLEALAAALAATPVVLLVDDDPAFRRTLGDLLAARGVASEPADGLASALALLRGTAPRVILLDLKLDDGDPCDTVRAIRQAAPAVPLVVYSGHVDALESAVASLPTEWFRAVLRKPFLPERLLEVLDDPHPR